MADAPRSTRARLARLWHPFWLLGAAAPWGWYLVRGLGAIAEAVAVLLPAICILVVVLFLVGAAFSRRWGPALVAASTLVFGVFATLVPRLPEDSATPENPIRIVSANIYSSNDTPQQAVDAILGQDPDVIVAVETPDGFDGLLAAQDGGGHPYVASLGPLLLRSRYPVFPMSTPANLPKSRVMRVSVDVPGSTVIVYVVHAFNPVYEGSFGQELTLVRRIQKDAQLEQLPVILAGDFNLSDRTEGYRELNGSFTDAMRGGGRAASTFDGGLFGWLFLRIDHLFIPQAWCSEDPTTFGVPGSDHRGIAASVGLCAVGT